MIHFIYHFIVKKQSSSAPVVLIKLVYKHANICFVTLYMMMPFLPDLSYYKNNLNTETIKSDLKIEIIKSDNVNKQV